MGWTSLESEGMFRELSSLSSQRIYDWLRNMHTRTVEDAMVERTSWQIMALTRSSQ
jgi:hypothetical protein